MERKNIHNWTPEQLKVVIEMKGDTKLVRALLPDLTRIQINNCVTNIGLRANRNITLEEVLLKRSQPRKRPSHQVPPGPRLLRPEKMRRGNDTVKRRCLRCREFFNARDRKKDWICCGLAPADYCDNEYSLVGSLRID